MNLRSLLLILLIVQLQPVAMAQNIGIGIGTSTPLSPLDLGPVSGNRMIFWGEGNQTHYGIGSQNGNMQIYANLSVDNIGFGLGSSAAFSQNLSIKGNGMVGIYNTNPEYRLDVNGRLKLSGIDSLIKIFIDPISLEILIMSRLQLPPQLYFNNPANTAAVAKIGALEGYNYATFFGILSENNIPRLGTLEGNSLCINGSIGEPGQILRSRGLNSGAYWTNPILPELHTQLYNAYGGNFQLTSALKLEELKREVSSEYGDYLNNSYEIKTASKLLVKYRISARNLSNSCSLCGPSIFDIVIADNDNIVRTFRYTIPVNTSDITLNASAILDAPIGWHQIKMGGYMVSGPNVDLGYFIGAPINNSTTDGTRMTIQVIPSFK